MAGLNIANEKLELRSFLSQQFVALAMTLGAMAFAVLALAALALVPIAIGALPLPTAVVAALDLARWPLLAVLLAIALAVTYRFGPYMEHPKWRWISWGAGDSDCPMVHRISVVLVLCLAFRFLRRDLRLSGRAGSAPPLVLDHGFDRIDGSRH